MGNVLGRPLAMKALILNYNVDFLASLFENAIFIHSSREPLANIASGLDARRRQYGSIDPWCSFKIREYPQLKELTPHEQVAGQIHYINDTVEKGLSQLPEHRRVAVDYEAFCHKPAVYYHYLRERLALFGHEFPMTYDGPGHFDVTRKAISDPAIIAAWSKFN